MRYGRIWPSSALLLHRDVKGSKSCWRLSHRMRGSRFALAGRRLRQAARTSAAASGCADANRIGRETDRCTASLDEASKRLETILGIGISGATMIAAVIPDRRVFRSGRDFAAVGRCREKRGLGAAPGGSGVPHVGGGNPCDQVIMSLRRRLSSNAADADSSIPS